MFILVYLIFKWVNISIQVGVFMSVKRIIIIISTIIVLALGITFITKFMNFTSDTSSIDELSSVTTVNGSLKDEIKSKYDNKKLSSTDVKNFISRYYTEKSVAVYLIECIEGKERNYETSYIKELTFGKSSYGDKNISTAKYPLLCTASYIDGGSIKVKGEGEKLERINVYDASLKNALLRPSIKKLTDVINDQDMFKSVLIVNNDSEIIGILFQRYK